MRCYRPSRWRSWWRASSTLHCRWSRLWTLTRWVMTEEVLALTVSHDWEIASTQWVMTERESASTHSESSLRVLALKVSHDWEWSVVITNVNTVVICQNTVYTRFIGPLHCYWSAYLEYEINYIYIYILWLHLSFFFVCVRCIYIMYMSHLSIC